MLWLSVLESMQSQWKRMVKSHDMKVVDHVSAGPSLNMTVKSGCNILLSSVKTCPTSQKSIETLLARGVYDSSESNRRNLSQGFSI